MASKDLEVVLKLKDALFKKGIGGAEGELKAFGKKATNIGKKAAGAFAVLGIGVAGLAKTFADFEKGMTNVATLIDTNAESMEAMGKQVREIGNRTPAALNDLTSALFDVRSAGFGAGDAMEVLEQSARLGVAGLASTKQATDIMTSALNTFKKEGLSAAEVSDILFKTQKFGKTTIAELSAAFGATAPIIQSAGIGLADFSAATAALTTVGIPAAQAQNSIRAAIVSLKKPTKEMELIFKNLGAKSGPDLIRTSDGLGDVFKKIQAEANRSGIAIEKAAGRVEGAVAITSLATSTSKAYTDALASMTTGANLVDEAFEKQKKTLASTFQLLVNSFQDAAISIGATLVPTLTILAEGLRNVAKFISNLPEPVKQALGNFLLLTTAVIGVTAALGLIIGHISTFIGAVTGAWAAMGGWAGITAVTSGALTTFAAFLGSTLLPAIVAIGGAVIILKTAWDHNFLGMRDALTELMRSMGLTQNMMFNFVNFMTAWEDIFDNLISQIRVAGNEVIRFARKLEAAAKFGGTGHFEAVSKSIDRTIDLQNQALAAQFGVRADERFSKLKKLIAAEARKPRAKSTLGGGPSVDPLAALGGGGGGDAKEQQKKQLAALKKITEALTAAMRENGIAMDESVASLGTSAKEANKLRLQLAKLIGDEKELTATQKKLSKITLSGKAEEKRLKKLDDINIQIRKNAVDQQKVETQLTRNFQEENRKRRDAFISLEETKQRIKLQFQKRADAFELKRLDKLLKDKKISHEDFIGQVAVITERQATAEVNQLREQIDHLTTKRKEMEAINGVTAETIRLLEEQANLEGRIEEVQQAAQQKTSETAQKLKDEFLEAFETIIENFNTTLIEGLIMGNLSIEEAFRQLLSSIVNLVAQTISTKIMEEFKKFWTGSEKGTDSLLTKMTKGFTKFAKGTTKMFTKFLKGFVKLFDIGIKGVNSAFSALGGNVLSVFAKIGKGAFDMAKSIFSAQKAAAFASAVAVSHEMALKAASAVAGIPVIGPALAVATYASMLAFGLAKSALINGVGLGFAEGSPDIDKTSLATVHQGEMIIPKTFAQAIRGGQLSVGGPDGSGGGGGGETVINISFDGAQFFGPPEEFVEQFEALLIQRKNIIGSKFQLEAS